MSTPVLTPTQSAAVRDEVAGMLAQSTAFQALPPATRAEIARNTTKIAETMASQSLAARGGKPVRAPVKRSRGGDDPYAAGLEETTAPDKDKWKADDAFKAEGLREGVQQAGALLKEVNFPGFVSSLVKGVFNAVVDASIQQMKAYGELVQSVAMSMNEFRDKNVSPAQGKSHLVSKYPQVFQIAAGEDGKEAVKMRDDFDTDLMPDFQKDLGMATPVEDVDDGAIEGLVMAARDDLARGRQQLLATTILMGINRIIVTDGRINAKLMFDFKAEDKLHRVGVSKELQIEHQRRVDAGIDDKGFTYGYSDTPVEIVVASVTSTSDANLRANATLTGEVSLNFKSETFPLQEMVNSDLFSRVKEARGSTGPVPAPAAAPATPTTPAR